MGRCGHRPLQIDFLLIRNIPFCRGGHPWPPAAVQFICTNSLQRKKVQLNCTPTQMNCVGIEMSAVFLAFELSQKHFEDVVYIEYETPLANLQEGFGVYRKYRRNL